TQWATEGCTLSLHDALPIYVGVVGVQFKLDGVNFGAEVTTAPYTLAWITSTASKGTHTLTAVARDAAGNTATSSSVTVTVTSFRSDERSVAKAGMSSSAPTI